MDYDDFDDLPFFCIDGSALRPSTAAALGSASAQRVVSAFGKKGLVYKMRHFISRCFGSAL